MSWLVLELLGVIIEVIPGVTEYNAMMAQMYLHLLDFMVTAVLIFYIYVVKQSTFKDLEQKYSTFHGKSFQFHQRVIFKSCLHV